MMRNVFWPLLACSLAACGGGGEDAAENLLPTTNIELHLRMRDAPELLHAALAAFEENNGIELRIGDGTEARPALVELDPIEFSEWLHADRLAPLPPELAELAAGCWGAEGAEWEGAIYGLPWRIRPEALLLAGGPVRPDDWPALRAYQNAEGPWASDAASLLPAVVALAMSADSLIADSAAPVVDSESWTEALSFFTSSLALDQLSDAAELERRLVSASLGIAPANPQRWKQLRNLQPDRSWTLAPYPPLDAAGGRARVALQTRFLVLPRSGAHADLAVSLAKQLHRRAGELLGAVPAGFLPASKSAELEWNDFERWQELLVHGFALPPFAGRASWERTLEHAVTQAIERKRNPAQALSDARRQFEGGQGR